MKSHVTQVLNCKTCPKISSFNILGPITLITKCK